jgi:hypothetical protein
MRKKQKWVKERRGKNIDDVMRNSADRILKISLAVERNIQRFWKELVMT